MNRLRIHRHSCGESTSQFRHVFADTLITPDQNTFQQRPGLPLCSLHTPGACLDHGDFNQNIHETLLDMTIFESPSETENQGYYNSDFQNSTSNCSIFPRNMNDLPSQHVRPQNKDNQMKKTSEKTNKPARDTKCRRSQKLFSKYLQNSEIVDAKTGVSSQTADTKPNTSLQTANKESDELSQILVTQPDNSSQILVTKPDNSSQILVTQPDNSSQVVDLKPDKHSFARINSKWNFVRNFKLNEPDVSRKKSSAISSRALFQRQSMPQSMCQYVRRKDIVFGSIIGKGGFGMVHTGHIHGQAVAVKVVQKRRGSGIHREILQAERLACSLNLRHENIVSILGLNLSDGLRGDALIVMELVSPLTLQTVLDDHTRSITQSERLTFALQISQALTYLHQNEVAHLDVKPRNVLMSDNTCKLGDFGSLTRTRQDGPREETEFTQLLADLCNALCHLGTLPYRAPELMKGCYPSSQADIYSLGITFWQLATRETPHSGANPHWLIYQVTKSNKRPDHHDTGSDDIEVKYRDLYTACWDAEPELRPNAGQVAVCLKAMLEHALNGTWSQVVKRNE